MKQETLVQNKSQLAKLMATENISVRHRPIKTAKFDLKNRVLHCPIWQDMDSNIYDMLLGHEISHALNTPLEGWHDTIVQDKQRPRLKGFLNIIEDARIEKLIKRKYPGLRKPFVEAYKSFMERDLFKVAKFKDDYSKLRLIDRINLRFKVGAHLNIEFDKEEMKFVDRVENVETFEEVAQLARDIYDYQKFKEPEKEKKKNDKKDDKSKDKKKGKGKDKKSKKGKEKSNDNDTGNEKDEDQDQDEDDSEPSEDGDDSDGNEEESDGGDESEDDDAEGDDDGDSSGDDEDEGDDGDGKQDKSANKNDDSKSCDKSAKGAGRDPEEPASLTDDAFREQEKELVNDRGEGQIYLDMPEADLKKIIIPNNIVLQKFELGIRTEFLNAHNTRNYHTNRTPLDFNFISAGMNKAFVKRNRGFISMLVKEFEMRKNAHQYARQLTSKTGELDDKKMSRYKLTDDIFRKVTTVTKGKSHGMIMFLDFSGSMSSTLRDILEQVLVLASFCKRVGIPFDVYGFGDTHTYQWSHYGLFKSVNGGFTFAPASFCLRHLISSNLSGNVYKRAFTMLNMVGQLSNYHDRDPEVSQLFPANNTNYCTSSLPNLGFGLGGTPFLECLVASKQIILEFREQQRVDITNVIYLTDGDGSQVLDHGPEYHAMAVNERSRTRIGFQDYKTKHRVLTDNETNVPYQTALTKLVAKVTGCRHIGYYFSGGDDIMSRVRSNLALKPKFAEYGKFLMDNGFIAAPCIGYDNYYYVDNSRLAYRKNLNVQANQTKEEMGHALSTHLKKKMNNRLITKQFAIDVAE